MPNLRLHRLEKLSAFRKLALGSWDDASDPSVYGTLELRMDRAVDYVEKFRQATGKRLTVMHMLVKATAMALAQMPEANAVIRWKTIYQREDISIFFQVAMTDDPGNVDLSGVNLKDVDKKSLAQICDEAQERIEKVRARKDAELEKTRDTFRRLPSMLLGPAFKVVSFLQYTLNLDLSALGVPKDTFGSAMITNIGSLGLDQAYVPLFPPSHTPILLAVGAVRDGLVVEDGKPAVAKVMKVNATFDHRLFDGYHAAIMSKVLRKWMEHPFEHFDRL
jgi:pyruvate dehydrogenase E2 component (dihydrolipoamide acetyltransferase)